MQQTWEPRPTATEHVINAFWARTLRAIRAVTGVAAPEQSAKVDAALRSIGNIDGETRALLHPDLYLWYFDLVAAARVSRSHPLRIERHLDGLQETLDRIQKSEQRAGALAERLGAPIDLLPERASLAPVLRAAERHADDIFPGHREHLEVVEASDDIVAKCRAGFELLASMWPDGFQETVRFVRRLIFVRGRRVIGFTDFRCHGTVFLNANKLADSSEPWEVAEELFHEASHNRLNAELALAPMFLNDPNATYSSPLRPDPRPMFGVFHQMYVLARLTSLYERIALQAGHALPERAATYRGFVQAFEIVDRNAQLTPAGVSLVESLRSAVGSLKPETDEAVIA